MAWISRRRSPDSAAWRRAPICWMPARCLDSGIESIARYGLAAENVPFVVHAVIHGLEVDVLVGRRS